MRLLFFGDLAATGFGTVTMDLGQALLNRGVDVRFLSQNDVGELPPPFDERTLDVLSLLHQQPAALTGNLHGGVAPQEPQFITRLLSGEANGMSLANRAPWGDWKPDAVLILGDFYGVRMIVEPYLAAFGEVPSYHYVPIEGHDLPPRWNDIWRVVKPIAMSKFGQREIAKVTGSQPPLMYHGVDTETFRPVSMTDPVVVADGKVVMSSKERCKAFFGIHPRAKVLLRADRNMPRKGYPAMLRALLPVMSERDDVVLAIKCRAYDQGGDLSDSISKLPPAVRERVVVQEGVMPRDILRALYNAADVYVSTSAEGFGLTLAESLACGVPAVGLDYSAVPEVIGPAGKTVSVGRLLDNEYGHHWALPDEDAFGRTVAYLLDHPTRARELGANGPGHIRDNFTWDRAADVMVGLLEKPDAVPVLEMVA